jgi:hypothetical protein
MVSPQNRPIIALDSNGRGIQDSALDESFRGEYTGTNLIYKGFARPGADEGALVWQLAILAYDISDNVLSIKFPQDSFGNASNEYVFSWTDRASYTYS